jgi:N-formylglutamate deformylase
MGAPFELLEPTGAETPIIVEIPHAGLELSPQFLEPMAAPARALARDADLYVDKLYEDAPVEGATVIVARASRYVVDLNRGEGDIDGEVIEGVRSGVQMHHGLIWRTTADGDPALGRKLSRAELDERLDLVWRPYHRALSELIERKRARFGLAFLLAAHSMPSMERPGGRDARGAQSSRTGRPARARADVVPGTRGRRSADGRFIDAVEAHAIGRGWTVRHDEPYAGGFSTQHYGRPAEGVHVVQIELARRLYLDEATLRPGPDFGSVRLWCRQLVAKVAKCGLAFAPA